MAFETRERMPGRRSRRSWRHLSSLPEDATSIVAIESDARLESVVGAINDALRGLDVRGMGAPIVLEFQSDVRPDLVRELIRGLRFHVEFVVSGGEQDGEADALAEAMDNQRSHEGDADAPESPSVSAKPDLEPYLNPVERLSTDGQRAWLERMREISGQDD